MGSQSTLSSDQPRTLILSPTGLVQSGPLQTYAQAVVDRSVLAIRGEGELNTMTYAGILRAKLPVLVRGVGRRFSGSYYTQRVLHVLAGDEYTQSFTVVRNATGVSGQEDFSVNNSA